MIRVRSGMRYCSMCSRRSSRVPRARRPLQHRAPVGGRRQLEDPRAVVADLLERHHDTLPVDGALAGNQVIVALAAVVVQVRGDDVARAGFDGVHHVADDVGVADVEADARSPEVQIVLQPLHQPRRRRQRVGNELEREVDADGLRGLADFLEAARHRGAAVAPPGPRTGRRGAATSVSNGTTEASPRPLIVSDTARCRRDLVAGGDRQRLAPLAVRKADGRRRVHGVEREARVVEPLAQRSGRRGS